MALELDYQVFTAVYVNVRPSFKGKQNMGDSEFMEFQLAPGVLGLEVCASTACMGNMILSGSPFFFDYFLNRYNIFK